MEQLPVTMSFKWAAADIMAQLTKEGGVRIWYKFQGSGQEKYEIVCTPDEWDRFVAWVEWQRKEAALKKAKES